MREQQDASGYRFGNSSNSNSGVPDESEHGKLMMMMVLVIRILPFLLTGVPPY